MTEQSGVELDVFTKPRNVVIVGASDVSTSWGYWLAKGALSGESLRPVHLVTRHGDAVQGRPSYTSLGQLPDKPDLVVLTVPAASISEVVTDALRLGARGFLGITADVSGTGDPKSRRDAEVKLAAEICAAGARLIGPNCLGLFDAAAKLSLAWGDFAPGGLALISQSGQVGLEIGSLAKSAGIGFSRFVSVGSQVDVTVAEALSALANDPLTRVAAVYVEDFGNARHLISAAVRLRERGIPVLLLHPGTSVSGARAAASHTAALAGSNEVIDAVARAGGMTRVLTPAALVGAAAVLLGAPSAYAGNARVGVVSDSGGQGVIAADLLESIGLELPQLSIATQAALHRIVPAHAGVANPVDLAGAGEAELANYAAAVELVAADASIDAVILSGYFGRYCIDTPDLCEREAQVAARLIEIASRRCVIVHSMADGGATADLLRGNGVPVFTTIEAAVAALGGASARIPSPPSGLPDAQEHSVDDARSRSDAQPAADPTGAGSKLSNYARVRASLESKGVRFPFAVTVPADSDARGAREAVIQAAISIPGSVVLKATSFEHKTEVGGVVVGLDEGSIGWAFDQLIERVGSTELTVEQQLSYPVGAVELLVGGRIDAVAGPLVVIAAGGVQAEYLVDSAAALAPVSREQAASLVAGLRVSRLLDGWRGAPAADLDALIGVIVAVSDVLCEPESKWRELEANPVLCWSGGAVALDAWGTPSDLQGFTGGDR
ncbi:MAG: acetate--CoA ligase family protein [Actinomycetes bacterium]